MSQNRPANLFPPRISSYIRAFIARRRAVLMLRGAGTVAAVGLAWALFACLIDRLIHLPAPARWAILIAGAAAAIYAGGRHVLRAFRAMDWIGAAGQIEARTDRFNQRLQTAVSRLLGPRDRRGSEAMLHQTLAEVESLAANSSGAALIPWRLALVPWLTAGAAAAIFAALWPVAALDVPRLVTRLVHPGRRIDPVTLTRLEVYPQGTEVSPGGSVSISAAVSGPQVAAINARGVDLYLSTDGRTWSRAVMNAVSLTDSQSRFAFPIPAIDRDLYYYVRGGDARSEEYDIKVKRIPAVAEFHIQYTYPPYTGHPPMTVTNTDGLIEALSGCVAMVTITTTEPLSSAMLTVDGQQWERLQMVSLGKPTEWRTQLSVVGNANCSLEMVSAAGVPGRGPAPMLLRALPDKPPVVVIEQPASDLRLAAADAITLHYSASDDYGLKSLEAVVRLNDAIVAVFPASLPPGALRREGEFTFDLLDLSPRIGDVVSLSLRAEDFADHVTQGEARQVLISPVSVNVKAFARAAELKRAARLAAAWNASLQKAREALEAARGMDPRNPKKDAWPLANRAMAAAGDAGTALRQALLRALLRGESPQFATAVASLIDETVSPALDPGRVLSAAARSDNALLDRLVNRINRGKEVSAAIGVLLEGEQALLAAAELANARAVAAAPAGNKAVGEIRARAIERARRLIDEVLREMSLNAGAGDLDRQLRQRVDREKTLLNGQKPVDYLAAAAEWSDRLRRPTTIGAAFPARLQSAAQVEALRPDSDLALARDLQLAARTAGAVAASTSAARDADRGRTQGPARAKLFEPLARFEKAFGTLLRDRAHAAEARDELSKLATEPAGAESVEELAFNANSAGVRHDADAAAQLDAKLADEIGRSSQEESSRFQDDAARLSRQAAVLDAILNRQQAARQLMDKADTASAAAAQQEVAGAIEASLRGGDPSAATQPAAEIHDMNDLSRGPAPSPEAAARNPLAAAAWLARAAAELLSGKGDIASVKARQQEAIAFLQLAWERSIRRGAHRRLEEVPSLATLFQPYAADEASGSLLARSWPRYGTRFHETIRADAAAGSTHQADPAGYQDQLKAYFDAITKAQKK